MPQKQRLGLPNSSLAEKLIQLTQLLPQMAQSPTSEAFINILALLGWNPGNNEELFSVDQLAELFSFERVHKSGAKFDPEKAKWFNQQYLRAKSDHELSQVFKPILKEKGFEKDDAFMIDFCFISLKI